jgi:hypothetical protein
MQQKPANIICIFLNLLKSAKITLFQKRAQTLTSEGNIYNFRHCRGKEIVCTQTNKVLATLIYENMYSQHNDEKAVNCLT